MTDPSRLDIDRANIGKDRRQRRAGRRRQFSDKQERQLIFEAAYRLLSEGGTAEASLSRILEAAGLSTRSFYRHFPSKDALLCAMYRRDAEWAARHIASAVDQADSGAEAVRVWIDEIFHMVRDPRRAERVSVVGSLLEVGAEGMEAEFLRANEMLVEPFQRAIDAGATAGVFRVGDSQRAANLLAGMVTQAAGLRPAQRSTIHHDQAEVALYVLRALGVVT